MQGAGLRIDLLGDLQPGAGDEGSDSALPAEQRVVLVVSVPLSEEAWQPLAEGELLVLRRGAVADRHTP